MIERWKKSMSSFVLFFNICLSVTIRDNCCMLFWTWDRLHFKHWSTAIELTHTICEATKHETNDCNTEMLIMEIMSGYFEVSSKKYIYICMYNYIYMYVCITVEIQYYQWQFGLALSAQTYGSSFCSSSAYVTHQMNEGACKYLTDIDRKIYPNIGSKRALQVWGELKRKRLTLLYMLHH